MLKLIKLELKRTNLRAYMIAALSITLSIIAILHIAGFASKASTGTAASIAETSPLTTASGFVGFFTVMMTLCFAVLAAVMFGRLIVNDYSGGNAVLLFSYPIKRSRIFLAKLVLVAGFTASSMILGSLVTLPIFMVSNAAFGFTAFEMGFPFFGGMLLAVLSASLVMVAIAMAGLWIGLWKNSLPATIVSVLIIMAPFTNALVGAIRTNPGLLGILAGLSAVFILAVYAGLVKSLQQREV